MRSLLLSVERNIYDFESLKLKTGLSHTEVNFIQEKFLAIPFDFLLIAKQKIVSKGKILFKIADEIE